MRSRALLITSLAALLTVSAQADSTEEVRRLDSEISVATWSRDAVWFEENLVDDYVLITPSGEVRTKVDVIRELSIPNMRMDPYEPAEVSVRLYGDAAVVTGRVTQRFVLGGIRYIKDLRYTDFYVRRKGRWFLVSSHTSQAPRRR